ncbi:hypothetical protein CYMTET_43611 [Cymbomonas tetramitiformis]|uniref:Uncharacterized protein n=1 Tax=Cymbomonas tetramitiformis TaxID=36881 RepID=A0AAE0C1R9_9CHLO|nr:hypothetical protein CYMTET_43611 [Cymbomonas tetramitiformis]
MSSSSVHTLPVGATARMRLDNIFSRNVGARYRITPQSPFVALAAADERRATVVLQSTWDVDVVKRVAKDTLGNKASSFSGSEPHRRVLWDSFLTSLQQSFAAKDSDSDDMFDLVDMDKEVNPIFNMPAWWVEASAHVSPRDGKRALLEITKRLLPPGQCPVRHHEELLSISFGVDDDPEPLVTQFHECLKAIDASGDGAMDEKTANDGSCRRPLTRSSTVRSLPRCGSTSTELAKVALEEIFSHVLEVWWCAHPNGVPSRANQALPVSHVVVAYAGGGDRDMRALVEGLERFKLEALGEITTFTWDTTDI